MKPRRLVIEGLRSHRERTEIDFSDVSLFAIVGDTGSGKRLDPRGHRLRPVRRGDLDEAAWRVDLRR